MSQLPQPPPPKVFGLGLGRTGTLSICHALERLGFGPCYHPLHVPKGEEKWLEWTRVVEGETDPEFIRSILKGYTSALDSPIALVAEAIYKTYPHAKYILSTRDPHKWYESSKRVFGGGSGADNAARTIEEQPLTEAQRVWIKATLRKYWSSKSTEEVLEDPNAWMRIVTHNEQIKKLIPADQLLVFDVKEGWAPLARFLQVPEPEEPFPRVNEAAAFWDNMRKET